jgi:LmbE family N-acetylglucosaminyl deacetylase
MHVATRGKGSDKAPLIPGDSYAASPLDQIKYLLRCRIHTVQSHPYETIGKPFADHVHAHHYVKDFVSSQRTSTRLTSNADLKRAKQGVLKCLRRSHLLPYLSGVVFP